MALLCFIAVLDNKLETVCTRHHGGQEYNASKINPPFMRGGERPLGDELWLGLLSAASPWGYGLQCRMFSRAVIVWL